VVATYSASLFVRILAITSALPTIRERFDATLPQPPFVDSRMLRP